MNDHPLFDNLLIRRDLRALRHTWWRNPGILLGCGVAIVAGALSVNFEKVFMIKVKPGYEEERLWYIFVILHLIVQICLPWRAVRIAREVFRRSDVDSLLVSPLPRTHFFAWLWVKAWAPAWLVLGFYFPLMKPFPWLRYVDGYSFPPPDVSFFESGAFLVGFEAFADVFFVLLLALPWIRRRDARFFICLGSALTLFLIPEALHRVGIRDASLLATEELASRLAPTHAHFHPAITVPYFLFTAAWGAAAGIYFGLTMRGAPDKALLWVMLLGPIADLAALHLVFIPDIFIAYTEPIWTIVYMLGFHGGPQGLLWWGLKWNLMVGLMRRFGGAVNEI